MNGRFEKLHQFFDRIPAWLLWIITIGALVATVWLAWDVYAKDSDLKPHSIVALELAFSVDEARQILGTWDEPVFNKALDRMGVDQWFTVSYVLLFIGIGLLCSRKSKISQRPTWIIIVLLSIILGIFDTIENVFVISELGTPPNQLGFTVVLLVGIATTAKFVLLPVVSIAMAAAVISGIYRVIGFFAEITGSKGHLCDLEEVRKAEAAYLKERRARARIGANDHWVGVALSGGGIRSATTNLGALQALSRLGLLRKVDYLSTVSGGGYIGSALSSLLSINGEKIDQSPSGGSEQYEFAARHKPYFGTEPANFPFNSDVKAARRSTNFNGRMQLEHLRTHGDFIALHQRLIHRDVLRVVGTFLGGIFYHLLIFAVLVTAVSAAYLALIGMLGWTIDSAREFFWYLKTLVGPRAEPFWQMPFVQAAGSGVLVSVLAIILIRLVVSALPDNWFFRRGESVEAYREYQSLWVLFWISALAVGLVTSWLAGNSQTPMLFLALPFAFYAGGSVVATLAYAALTIAPTFDRNTRSYYAACKGQYAYLTVAALVFALFPFLFVWVQEEAAKVGFTGPTVVWLLSLIGAWLFSKEGITGAWKQAKGWIDTFRALPGVLRRLALGIAVTVVIAAGIVLASLLLVDLEATLISKGLVNTDLTTYRWYVAGGVFLFFVFLGFFLDFNKLSLHYPYRDRLVEAYLRTAARTGGGPVPGRLALKRDNAEMPLTHLHGVPEPVVTGGWWHWLKRLCPLLPIGYPFPVIKATTCVTAAPYHLVETCLNLTNSSDMIRRDRKSDYFIFSKLYCGSDTTGYIETTRYRGGETKLARAMTISGAAASSAVGRQTFFAQSFVTTLLNIRLGQWMENPRYRDGAWSYRQENLVFWPKYLLKEMLASMDANSRLVNLSDGGHTGDNIGIRPLLRRRCRLIIAYDAEQDPKYFFGSLNEALRQAYIDENIVVDLDLDPIRPNSEWSQRHFAIGKISYPPQTEDGPDEEGWLIVVKSSLTGNEPETIKNYKRNNPDFPHQSTGDQFFDDDQFESYRALGQHMTEETFKHLPRFSKSNRPREWENECKRLWGKPPRKRRGRAT